MCRYLKFIQKKWRQQGAILAFTALLLPMIIVGTGLAVDLGNIYVNYSRLQNAADAAALAGVHAFADKKEKPQKGMHSNADTLAKKYIKGEYHNIDKKEEIIKYNDETFTAGASDNAIYYKVKLEKEVPLYFLGVIYEKISGKNTFNVPAESVACIPIKKGGNNWFKNSMIIFKKSYMDTNSVENWDTLINPNTSPSADIVKDTFDDGRIIYTNGDGTNNSNFKYDYLRYSGQMESLDKFYTTKAKEDYKKTRDRRVLLDEKGEGTYWFKATYDVYDFDAFIKYMDELTKNATRITEQSYNAKKEELKSKDMLRVSNVPNLTFTIKESLGNEDKPLYIYVDEGPGLVKFNLEADTGRPLIICLGGNNNKRNQVELDLNGHTFKGVFYAPYCEDTSWGWPPQGVLVKSNGSDSKFIGTLVGSAITIQNYNMHFSYKDYIGGGSGSSGVVTSTDGIALVSPPDSIKWE